MLVRSYQAIWVSSRSHAGVSSGRAAAPASGSGTGSIGLGARNCMLSRPRSIRARPLCQQGLSGKLTTLNTPVETWLEAVRGAARRGELLTAVDLAEQGLSEWPDELWLKHASVLALARAGATEEAAARFERYGLADAEEEDVAGLGARLAKDLALATAGPERLRGAATAGDLY